AHLEAQRLARRRADARLEKGTPPFVLSADRGNVWRAAARQPFGGNDRHAARLEIAQIRFVGVPPDDLEWVMERDGHPLRPRDEGVALLLVVPRRPDQDSVERGPVDGRIVPDDLRRVDAAGGERVVKRTIVDFPRGNGGAGRERQSY